MVRNPSYNYNETTMTEVIGHIAKLIGMPRHSRHVGQGQIGSRFNGNDELDLS